MTPFTFPGKTLISDIFYSFFSDDAISIISIIMASSICACVNCSAKQEAGRNYILISGIIDKEFKGYVISYKKGKTRSTASRLRDDYLCRKCLEILRRKFKAEQKGSYYASVNSKHHHPPRATPGVLHSTAVPGPGFILDDLPQGLGFCISIKFRLVQ